MLIVVTEVPPTQMQHYGPQVQGQNQHVQQPYFQYSQCTGKKKALCVCHNVDLSACHSANIFPDKIGINYVGQSGELRGCHNDARNLVNFLCSEYYGSADSCSHGIMRCRPFWL